MRGRLAKAAEREGTLSLILLQEMAGNDSYSVNEILLTADTLAKAGGVVPAISLLEAAVKGTK